MSLTGKIGAESFFQKNCPCLKKQSRLVKFLIYVVGGILWLYLLWKGFILFEGVMTALYDIKDFVANGKIVSG
jgi:hypothetical protein